MNRTTSTVRTYKTASFNAKVVAYGGTHKAVLKAPMYYQHFLNTQTKPGDAITISIKTSRPKRSVAQNNFYWLYLGIISKETGNDMEDLHEFFKGKFLGGEIIEIFGEKVRRKGSTTNLSINDFSEYIDKISALTEIAPPPTENYYD